MSEAINQPEQLYKILGYSFTDEKILTRALTHRSSAGKHNERYEFLGDSILNFVIGEALFEKFPHAKEGELSRLRANLVNGETLADIALEKGVGEFMILGVGEAQSGGSKRRSINADVMEALICGIYLDGGMDVAKAAVLNWYEKRLNEIELAPHLKDAKSRLQEYLQARSLDLPSYEIKKITGQAHDQTFYIICEVPALALLAEGVGSSRRRAEQIAAENLLSQLPDIL